MKPFFSVVTTTYNRAELIGRVFKSLMAQTFKDFEWVIVDDGSVDGTEMVVEDFIAASFFNIKYVKTDNKGKASALNTSLKYCGGILYLVFDSDDWCDSDALEVFYREYVSINKEDRDRYFALSCLKRGVDGRIVGEDYSNMERYGLTYIDRLNRGVKGDKWECLVLEKVKDCLYPLSQGEKYMPPSYVWIKMAAQGYKTVFINKSLSVVEYQLDGISAQNIRHRLSSLGNIVRYNSEFYKLSSAKYTVKGRYYANYVRFSLHHRRWPRLAIGLSPFLFIGVVLYFRDFFASN